MNAKLEITRLKQKFPGKPIILLPVDNPSEIICEIESSNDHPEYSIATAVIDQSAPHHHLRSVETYKVERGQLILTENGIEMTLEEGDTHTIYPPTVHSARGNATVVKVKSEPGWTAQDHILDFSTA